MWARQVAKCEQAATQMQQVFLRLQVDQASQDLLQKQQFSTLLQIRVSSWPMLLSSV